MDVSGELVVSLARAATALVVLVLMCAIVCSAIVLMLEEMGLRSLQHQHGLQRWLDTLDPETGQAPEPVQVSQKPGAERLQAALAPSLHLPVRQLVGVLASMLQTESSSEMPSAFVSWFAGAGSLERDRDRYLQVGSKLLPLHLERALDGLQSQLIRAQTVFRYMVAFFVTFLLFLILRMLASHGEAMIGQTLTLAMLIPVFTFPFVPIFCNLLDRVVTRD